MNNQTETQTEKAFIAELKRLENLVFKVDPNKDTPKVCLELYQKIGECNQHFQTCKRWKEFLLNETNEGSCSLKTRANVIRKLSDLENALRLYKGADVI